MARERKKPEEPNELRWLTTYADVVTLLMAGEPQRWVEWTIALLAAWGISTAILLFAPLLSRLLGRRGLLAVERLMGLLLTSIAVQMLITGIKESFFTV